MPDNLGSALEQAGGRRQQKEGVTISTFLASLGTAIVIFAVEFLLFLLLKGKLTRIYQPRTYLVPDRERTDPSPPGLFRWIKPVFRTSSTEFIQKCGLDAYFFLRYLRMLMKIFLPLAVVVLPVLLPLNKADGKDRTFKNGTESGGRWNVSGLDQLAWGNVKPEHTHRYWGHCVMAVITVIYVCAVFYDELRGYIRLRQAYLTSPQHRLRASATTVLVTAIPKRWLSEEALDGLYDVFPGGIRNIWINRDFDDLNEKVKERDKLALKLEGAETELVIKCKKAQLKQAKAEAKKAGKNARIVAEEEKKAADDHANQMAMEAGISSGDPHQARTLDQILRRRGTASGEWKRFNPIEPAVGAADAVGQGVGKLGKSVLGGLKKVTRTGDSSSEHRLSNSDEDNNANDDDYDNNNNGKNNNKARQNDLSRSSHDDNPVNVEDTDTNETATELETDTTATREQEKEKEQKAKKSFWKKRASANSKTSKTSSKTQPDEYPLTQPESPVACEAEPPISSRRNTPKKGESRKEGDQEEDQEYPCAYNEGFEDEDFGDPTWKKYIKPKDRDTMRLPIFGWSWMPSIWLMGKKVDTIDHCRKEVARLNLEIEIDQQNPEKFPLMNSAFIQFNHQVAAHMACQAVSHHVPKQMTPRIVEISPDDVIWDNMSIKWWERYLRTFGILTLVIGMVIGWAFPVAFTGLLSQLTYLESTFPWLQWLGKLPDWFISAIQGVLPALFLAILMAILPLILRFLSKAQGNHTGMGVELTVQNYYFAFLFVQLFLVVAISSSFSTVINNVTNVTSWPEMLAQNIPSSSNYFFSYMILQAMSVSAGALVQIFSLVSWYILAPMLDTTARTKWGRTTNLNQMQWGTFFPVYTTLASIGLIYCVIAPLILVFNVITFSLFWFVYRYNTLYVTKFRFDTGGLLFPRAINQLFTGLYIMEFSLIGLFFLVRDVEGKVACDGQAICMIVTLVLTIGFQWLLNEAFNPLIRYLPITLEDDAIRRDEEFSRAQHARLGLDNEEEEEQEDEQEKAQEEEDRAECAVDDSVGSGNIELKKLEHKAGQEESSQASNSRLTTPKIRPRNTSWASRSSRQRSKYYNNPNANSSVSSVQRIRDNMAVDAESGNLTSGRQARALFAGVQDELEDLTPDERDKLVQRAFQHDALRAKRPVVWIPRDDLGVSDDEVYRTQQFSKHIWISNEYQALDGKCRTIFSRSPPDFSEVDLIQL